MGVLDGVNIVRSVMMGKVTVSDIKEQLDELIDITAEQFDDLTMMCVVYHGPVGTSGKKGMEQSQADETEKGEGAENE